MKKNKKKKQPKPRMSAEMKINAKQQVKKLVLAELNKQKETLADEISHVSILAVAIAARDEFGFGQQRILKLVKKFLDEFNAVIDGYINFKDIEETLKEEVNIDFNNLNEEIKNKLGG